MGHKTSEEIKAEMFEKLGPEFGSLFYSLDTEITWLTFKWVEFNELYGTKETRIELMNKSAQFFFFMLQKVFWENLLLGICRITDRPETVGKKNMTMTSLPTFLTDENFKKEINTDIKALLAESEFCRDWRNRWITHADYELATDAQNAKPLEHATRRQLETVIERIQSIYNKIAFKYLGTTTYFKFVRSNQGGIALLRVIEGGIRFDKEAYEKKLRGDWTDDNFQSKV
jgi:hypothetical protein